MLLLALDTSTRQSSIALCSEDEFYGEYTWSTDNNHSVELLDYIQRLLAECKVTLPQLDAVAVATGPGSFNGVRVALATAKALSFALQKSLIGVSTLDIIASQQRLARVPICAVLEAGRTELYAACYVSDELRSGGGELTSRLRRLGDYILFTPQSLVASFQEHASEWCCIPGERTLPPFLFCCEMNASSRQALRAQMQERSLFIDSIQSTRRASTLAMLALQRLQDGILDDPLSLEPLYLRRPSITTSSRKQPLLGGAAQRTTGQLTTEREEGALRH